MARRGGGLRAVIKVAKAIDKAGKQVARDAERRQKANAREQAKAEREYQKQLREQERAEKNRINQAKHAAKLNVARTKQQFKDSLVYAQEEYVERCSERAALRKQFINAVLR